MTKFFNGIFRLIYFLWARPNLILRRANFLELDISGDLPEQKTRTNLLQRFFAKPITSFSELIFALKEAELDQRIKGCLVRIGDSSLGWGRACELREAFHQFREKGKKAIAYLKESGNLEYFIATACDEIVLCPSQSLNLVGLLTEVIYFKGALDKLEIKAELLQAGRYKSAVEPYIRDSMSEEHRESLNAILDEVLEELLRAISQSRNLPKEKARELIDQAPFLPEEAKALGLIDRIFYPDQMEEYIEGLLGEPIRKINAEHYYHLRLLGQGAFDGFRRLPRLALVYGTGVIREEDEYDYDDFGEEITSEKMVRGLREIRENPRVKAVVVRLDSPGGSAIASDLIWREMSLLRKEKPLMVSMADVSASGGYYIAMAGERILAEPISLTGSIGVIAGKLNLSGLYHKVGIKKEQVKRGESADLFSDYTSLSGAKQDKVRKELEYFYQDFVKKASEQRKMSFEELEQRAQGRVWTGNQALKLGLIDELGGLRKAVELAKQAIGLKPEDKVRMEIYPKARRRLLPMFPFRIPIFPFFKNQELKWLNQFQKLSKKRILFFIPFLIRIK